MNTPPKLPQALMQYLLRDEYLEELEGDMQEVYDEFCENHPKTKANRLYLLEVLRLCRPALIKKISGSLKLNRYGMIQLLFKISSRNLLKYKMVSVMSLVTLILGTISFQLVYAWIHNEVSMDTFHARAHRIYIGTARLNPNADVMAGHIQRLFGLDYNQFPEIEKTAIIHNYQPGEIQFISTGRSFQGTALIADSTFFDLFSFPLLYGSEPSLSDPTSILVTETYAKKVWGEVYPVGKLVKIKCDQEGTYQVAGVLKDIPSYSSIYFDFLVPRHSQRFWRRMPQDLILLSEEANIDLLNARFPELVSASRFKEGSVSFYPFSQVYDEQPFNISLFAKYGDKTTFLVMQIVAIALFLITVFGFTNIQSTALLSMTKTLGIKRVIGAQKWELLMEVIASMLLYAVIAIIVSFVGIELVFDHYTQALGLDIDHDSWLSISMISLVTGCIVLITILLQVWRLSGISALETLSTKVNLFKVAYGQKVATTLQYTIAISLVIATAMVYLQVRHLLNKDTGLNQSDIIQTRFFDILPSARQDSLERTRLLQRHRYMMDRLEQTPSIASVSLGQPPLDFAYTNSWRLNGSTEAYIPTKTLSVDPAYAEVFDLDMIDGRFFNDTLDTNGDLKVVINEAARKQWGLTELTSAKIETNTRGSADPRVYHVIGVVKDFNYEHLSQAVKPLVMPYFFYEDGELLIRHKAGQEKEAMAFIEKLYYDINQAGFFQATTFQDRVAMQYINEKKTNKIYLSFGVVALILSSLSLFTYTYHETKRRTKEIGIRKVNGATMLDVFKLLSTSFLSTIVVAFVLACPVVWYFLRSWLDHFTHRVPLAWWIFALSGLTVLGLGMAVVSWHVLRLARLNPVTSLRDE